jgi:histidinol dehydrogenase
VLTRIDLRGAPASIGSWTAVDAADETVAAVREIIADVRARGDAALRDLTERFDGVVVDELRVGADELAEAFDTASADLRDALAYAAARIRAYHEAQAATPTVEVQGDGIDLHELVRAVDRAGAYVPGGRAAYPSTLLMTVIPARVAGVREVAVCVPPGPDGRVASATLAAAWSAGADEVYRVGGAQAIAALAYGTESIPPVDVVVGPGNAYVACAKREVAGVVGIDSLAGPSELVVVADASVPASFAAADLLAQAEHGPGGAAVLVTWDPAVADDVDAALTALAADAPRRADIESTLATGGRIVLVDDAAAAVDVANAIAPEHLELLTEDPDALVPLVRNAGAVFCGPWAPAVLGDYAAGVNHVLPTARTARFASALRVDTFRKHIHVVRATEDGLAGAARHVEALAAVEGLDAHRASIAIRQRTAQRQATP